MDYRGVHWPEEVLLTFCSEIGDLKRAIEILYAVQCPCLLYTGEIPPLDHLVQNLNRLGRYPFRDVRLFEHLDMLIEQSVRTTS